MLLSALALSPSCSATFLLNSTQQASFLWQVFGELITSASTSWSLEFSMSTSLITTMLTLEHWRAITEEIMDRTRQDPSTRPRTKGGTSQSFSSIPSLHSLILLHFVARIVTLSINSLSQVKVADLGKAFMSLHFSKSSSSFSGQWIIPSQISSFLRRGVFPEIGSVELQDMGYSSASLYQCRFLKIDENQYNKSSNLFIS